MERDLHDNIDDLVALDSQDISTDTTTAGNIIDTQGYESLEYLIISGAIADGVFTTLLEEGDDSGLSDAAVVSSDERLGSLPVFTDAADSDKIKRVGVIGKKRYQRLSLVSTSVTGANILVAGVILGHPKHAPVAQ